MKLAEPEQGVRDKEVADLVPAEIEDVGAPVELLAAHRVGMLVQRGAVESGQRPVVLGEVGRHPVDDHGDVPGVQVVDEVAEVVGRSEACRRRVVRRDLVTPGAAERVLGDGQELDVGEALLDGVIGQLVREFAVAEALAPRREVDLVDAHRLTLGRGPFPARDPRVVGPDMFGHGDPGRGCRGRAGAEGHGVGLVADDAVGAMDPELVVGPVADVGDEDLPHPADPDLAHRRNAPGPVVEVADHGDTVGIRRPHGEGGAVHVAVGGRVRRHPRTEGVPQFLVAALAEQMDVDVAEARQEPVTVGHDEFRGAPGGIGVDDAVPVVHEVGHRHGDHPQVVGLAGHRMIDSADDRRHRDRVRAQGAQDRRAAGRVVGAEEGVWIGMGLRREPTQVVVGRVGVGQVWRIGAIGH